MVVKLRVQRSYNGFTLARLHRFPFAGGLGIEATPGRNPMMLEITSDGTP